MPLVELIQEVRVDLEQIECGGVRHARGFHEAEEQEEIVQLRGLLPQVALVAREHGAAQDVAQAVPDQREAHRPTRILSRIALPPRLSSPKSFETPPLPRMPPTRVCAYSPAILTHGWTRNSMPPSTARPFADASVFSAASAKP